MPYVRTVKTASGATAVQIVYSSRRGSRDIEHIGSAHDDAELELLTAAARQRLAAGQGELDLGLDASAAGGPLPITAVPLGASCSDHRRAGWFFVPLVFHSRYGVPSRSTKGEGSIDPPNEG